MFVFISFNVSFLVRARAKFTINKLRKTNLWRLFFFRFQVVMMKLKIHQLRYYINYFYTIGNILSKNIYFDDGDGGGGSGRPKERHHSEKNSGHAA